MVENSAYVGPDIHKDTISVAVALPGGSGSRWVATRGFSSCHPPLQGFAWRNIRSTKP